MKLIKHILTCILVFITVIASINTPVYAADSFGTVGIVTIGSDLTAEQEEQMFEYFGVSRDTVQILIVNNKDEHKYLDGIATSNQIGTHTYSCCYIQPTESGGINVKTYNLNWVTDEMIKNALVTSGITNCNIVAASPIEVSGTGALTGVFKAYETVDGLGKLDSNKINAASEELVTTSEAAEDIGQQAASDMIESLKEEIITAKNNNQEVDIPSLVDKYILDKGLKLTPEHRQQIIDLLTKISDLDYDIDQIEAAYGKLKSAYDTTMKTLDETKEKAEETKNFLDKIIDFFRGLFEKISSIFNNTESSTEEVSTTASSILEDNTSSNEADTSSNKANTSSNEASTESILDSLQYQE